MADLHGWRRHRVLHHSTYHLARPTRPEVVVQLQPASGPRQRGRLIQIGARPLPKEVVAFDDALENRCHRLSFGAPLSTLALWVVSEVERPLAPPAWPAIAWEELVVPGADEPTPLVDPAAFAGHGDACFAPGRRLAEVVASLHRRLREDMRYDERALSSGELEPAAVALKRGVGVCSDFAQVMLGALRARGLPARQVGGYLVRGRSAELHAWVALRVGDDWLEIDPTSGELAGPRHLRVAWGRDGSDLRPVRVDAEVRRVSSRIEVGS
ncbi:MAG: transglutaminase family protein [Myxococcales bacterium]|nr:transglutaminase family protein [Myxococcales bacterium]